MARRRLDHNEFVMTISDDEARSIDAVDETEMSGTREPLIHRGKIRKKRKRGDGDNVASSRARNDRSKKLKARDSKPEDVFARENYTSSDSGEDDGALDSEFEFQTGDSVDNIGEFEGWDFDNAKLEKRSDKQAVDIDEIIAKRLSRKGRSNKTSDNKEPQGDQQQRHEDSNEDTDSESIVSLGVDDDELLAEDGFGMGAPEAGHNGIAVDDESSNGGSNSNDSERDSDNESIASPVAHPDDVEESVTPSKNEEHDPAEIARREAFFAPEEKPNGKYKFTKGSLNSFQSMSLSRPILRGLASVGFSEPTPIQSKTIPVALLGKDVVGGAVTGSGKTAAFIVPILERLLYRPKKVSTSRVAILAPTRELAIQCHSVACKLASFTDIKFCLAVGGLSLKIQEAELRLRPDVIIATPGRFIDHMRNSPSFTVDTLEILVLDEADRMLEDGFADELNEILTTIPKSRQTMLFSATMTDSVDKLIRVGLNRPVRLMVDAKKQTVATLVQEFVRIRPGREDKRLGYLLLLCEGVYTERVIVFFRQKKEAHRARVVFGLCGLKAAELHGSMSQEQRIRSIEAFRDGRVSFLLATDLASRGLDIKGVDTVINYEAPQSHEIYLHRVGRTARAGRTGRACTIAAEPDRKVIKAAVKAGRVQGAKIVSRTVDPNAADKWAKAIEDLHGEIEEVLKEEKEEKQLSQVEMQLKRGENIIDHQDEIMAKPKRTWFESEKEKRRAKILGKVELNGPEAVGRKEKRKLSNKMKKKLDDRERRETGRVWKKGALERAGKGALEKSSKGSKTPKGKRGGSAGVGKESGSRSVGKR
ncbi:nucleolar DEAD-box protein required for synthesis of 60S ribosomal subunit [Glutinoglossum americanum]|uniref:RNA helicase n=1 Tax=Glutinoglossum americanum TaxID=1670608 RepID=A0A9P8I6E0_9PEZI|nr:nucleolar DEAD-box protein required for synthesis of 60S ribosomal subunit [Glutinoglossum americanum]